MRFNNLQWFWFRLFNSNNNAKAASKIEKGQEPDQKHRNSDSDAIGRATNIFISSPSDHQFGIEKSESIQMGGIKTKKNSNTSVNCVGVDLGELSLHLNNIHRNKNNNNQTHNNKRSSSNIEGSIIGDLEENNCRINNYSNYNSNYNYNGSEGRNSFELEMGMPSKDLYQCLRPFLIFGRLVGIMPVHGLFQKDSNLLYYKKWSVSGFLCMLIAFCLILNVIVGVIGLFQTSSKNVPEIVWASNPCMFFFMGCFGYIYMLTHADSLILLLNQWTFYTRQLSFRIPDRRLSRDANLIFGFIFSSAILENLLQQLIQLSIFDLSKSTAGNGTGTSSINTTHRLSPLESYFNKTKQPNWGALFSYHPILSVFLFISNKSSLYSWNFIDILIIVLARAAAFQFKTIFQYTETHIVNNLTTGLFNFDKWQTISKDFELLFSLLEELKRFLSPLLFTSYAVNLFFIIIHLHMGLMPATVTSPATEVYRTWSFVQISCRLYLITLFAAQVNEYANEFTALYRKCPTDCYSISVQRADRFSRSIKLGLTGLNCFVVTKPFMLNLVSVVLTFEIVLMQTSGFHGYFE